MMERDEEGGRRRGGGAGASIVSSPHQKPTVAESLSSTTTGRVHPLTFSFFGLRHRRGQFALRLCPSLHQGAAPTHRHPKASPPIQSPMLHSLHAILHSMPPSTPLPPTPLSQQPSPDSTTSCHLPPSSSSSDLTPHQLWTVLQTPEMQAAMQQLALARMQEGIVRWMAASQAVATSSPSVSLGSIAVSATKRQSSPSMAVPSAMDNTITLWQFLYELLNTNEYPQLLTWTSNEGEFKFHDAEGVAKLWGSRKAKPNMNYDKLSRALRYYYDKNIIKKVNGQKFVYRFVGFPDHVGQSSTANPPPTASPPSRSGGSSYRDPSRGFPAIDLCLPSSMPPRGYPVPFSVPSSTPSAFSSIHSTPPSFASVLSAGILSGMPSTPSPSDSACSPGSVGSHSTTSASGTSATSAEQRHPMAPSHSSSSSLHQIGMPPPCSLLSLPGPSSHALQSIGNNSHAMAWQVKNEPVEEVETRKRPTPSGGFDPREDDDLKPPRIDFSMASSPKSSSMATTPTSSGLRRPRPEPLNLSSVSAVRGGEEGDETPMQTASTETAPSTTTEGGEGAEGTPPLPQLTSPYLIPTVGSIVQLYATALSASLYGPNSPLTFPSPLLAPLNPLAQAVTSSFAHPSTSGVTTVSSTTSIVKPVPQQVFQFPPPMHSPLTAGLLRLLSPAGKTGTPGASGQVSHFQFPPSSPLHSTAASMAAALLSPAAGSLASLSSVFAHRYAGDDLRTPTANIKTPLPISIKELN